MTTISNLVATIMQGQALAKGQKDAKDKLTEQYDEAGRATLTIRKDPVTGKPLMDARNAPMSMFTGEDQDAEVEKAYNDPLEKVRWVLKASGMPVYSGEMASDENTDSFGDRKRIAKELGAKGPFAYIDAARLGNDDLRKRNLERVNQRRIEKDVANYNKLRPVIQEEEQRVEHARKTKEAAESRERGMKTLAINFTKGEDFSEFENLEAAMEFGLGSLAELGIEPSDTDKKRIEARYVSQRRDREKEIAQLEKIRKAADAPAGGKPRAPKAPLQGWSVQTKLRAVGMSSIDQEALALSLDSDYAKMKTSVEDAQTVADQAAAEVQDLVSELQELQKTPPSSLLYEPEKIAKLEKRIAEADLKRRQQESKIRRWTEDMTAIEAAASGTSDQPAAQQDRLGLFN